MHFIIDYQNLNKIKCLLQVFANSNNVDKKKDNILLSCSKECLNVYANNGVTSCKLVIDGENIKIFKPNEVFINSKTFLSLIDHLRNHKKIEFTAHEDNLLEIKSEDFLCSLVCVGKEEYIYDTFDVSAYELITFKSSELKLTITRLKEFCKSMNNTINKNTLLTNINFRKKRGLNHYSVTCTDSYRIIFATFSCNSDVAFEFNISPHCLGNIASIFAEDGSDQVNFYYLEDKFIVKTDNIFLKSKIFAGDYPEFSEWFEQASDVSFEINKQVLLSALDRNLFLSNSNFINTSSFSLSENTMMIEYKDSEKGFSKEKLAVKNNHGHDISFSLNSSYLKQLIKNIPSENIVFHITEAFKPIVFFGTENDSNFKHLILPLKNN